MSEPGPPKVDEAASPPLIWMLEMSGSRPIVFVLQHEPGERSGSRC